MKLIQSLNLDTSNIKRLGEGRPFSVVGDTGAVFTLEVRRQPVAGASGMHNYYNFSTNLFQTAETKLNNITIPSGGTYSGHIKFPLAELGTQYDIYLFAEDNYDTRHVDYSEIRFADNSIDINSSKGSMSNILQKVVYQTLDVTITLQGASPNSGVTTSALGTQVITASREKNIGKIPFSFTTTVTALKSLVINQQPPDSCIFALLRSVVGSEPVNIEGEDIYPTITDTDTVDGAVSSATKIVMDNNVADNMAVGDKVTGTGIPATSTVTVVALNPDTDNAKEFSVSEAVSIDDGVTLSFSNRRNYRWPMADISKFAVGMEFVKSVYFGTAALPGSPAVTIKEYLEQTTVYEGTPDEYKIDKIRSPGLDDLGVPPTITRNATTKVATTVQTGEVTFSHPALLSFGGVNSKIYAYGNSNIKVATGYDVEFSDLAVTLAKISTTTTTAPSNSTSWNITSAVGIAENVSTVSGIGIASGVVDPTVTTITNIGGATWDNSGGATITVSAAQTLESGITLDFTGAGTVATITGNILVKTVGNEDVTLYFDLEKFLTMQAAP